MNEPGADGVATVGAASPLKCPMCKTALEEAARDVFVGPIHMLRAQRTQPPEAWG